MKRGYVAMVLDLSLPLSGEKEKVEAARLGRALRETMRLFERRPAQRLEVALAGAVTASLLRHGQEEALQHLAERAGLGQIAFLSTACHGAFLPLVPRSEARRQIDLCEAMNREALGDFVYCPDGLFPPQLGVSRSVAELAFQRGLTRLVLDDLAYHGRSIPLPRDRHFVLRGLEDLRLFFADRTLSEAVAFGALTDARELHRLLGRRRSGYAVLRIPGRLLVQGSAGLRLLWDLDERAPVLPASFEELLALFPEREAVEPLPCALGTDYPELASGSPFAKWSAPGNELHALLWRLAQLASEEAERLSARGTITPEAGALRALLDTSLDCAAWRYASGKPELDPARVQEGATRLVQAIRAGGSAVRASVRREAEEAYERLSRRCLELAVRLAQVEAEASA